MVGIGGDGRRGGAKGLLWGAKGRCEVFDKGRTYRRHRAGPDGGQEHSCWSAVPELTLSIPCSFLTFRASSFARKSAKPWGGRTRGTRSLTGVTAGLSTRVSSSSGWSRLATSEKYRASSRTYVRGGGASEGPAGARAWQPGPHIPLTLRGSQPRKEARKLELLEKSHITLTPGGKLAPTQPETPTVAATKSRLSPWARGAHQAGSSRLRRPSTSPGEGDRPVTGSPQEGAPRGVLGTPERTCAGELCRLGLLPGQTRAGQPPVPQPWQHQRLCPLPGGAGPEAQKRGVALLTWRREERRRAVPAPEPLRLCSPLPTVSGETKDTAPSRVDVVLGLRTPPGTLGRGRNTHPAPHAADPRQPPFLAPPHLPLPPPVDGVLAAPLQRPPAPSPSPGPGLLFTPAH